MSYWLIAQFVLCFVILYVVYKVLSWLIRQPRVSGIHNKYVLITGCSSGFGLAAVKRFDTLGCHVFAGVRDPDSADRIRSLCSTRVVPVFLDVTKPESVEKCYQQVVKLLPKKGGLWGLVNNAGVSSPVKGPADWNTTDSYRYTMEVNTFGLIDVTLRFLPLIKQARGRVVNVTSVLGVLYSPCYSTYAVSKHAAEVFTDAFRCEMSYFGIKTSIVEPGPFLTNINDFSRYQEQAKHTINSLPQEIKEQYGEQYIEKILSPRPHQTTLGSKDFTPVVDAYTHALFAVFPHARYVAGKGMNLIIFLYRILPEWLYDFLAKRNAPVPDVYKNNKWLPF